MIAEPPIEFRICNVWPILSLVCLTTYDRLLRTKLLRKTRAFFIFSLSIMSFTTSLVAVAVRASTGTSGLISLTLAIDRKEGRKSYPHCDIQWASSTTIIDMLICDNWLRNVVLDNLSGETYRNLQRPLVQRSITLRRSV